MNISGLSRIINEQVKYIVDSGWEATSKEGIYQDPISKRELVLYDAFTIQYHRDCEELNRKDTQTLGWARKYLGI